MLKSFKNSIFFLFVISLTVLGGCSKKDTPQTVVMGYLPMISSLTYFVALDQGYFMDEGLKVEGIPITTSNDIAASLSRGDINVGVELSIVPLLRKLENEVEPSSKIFSTSIIVEEGGFDSVIVKDSSELSSLRDLSGRKVAVFPGTTAKNTFLSVFTKNFPQLTPPDLIPMSPAVHLSALDSGDVDALHAYEPFLTIGLTQMNMRRINSSLYAEQMAPSPSPIGVAAINASWAENNKELARKSISALDKAADFIGKFPYKARLIASEYTGIDSQIAPEMNFMPMSLSTEIDSEGLDKYFKILKEMGELQSTPKVSSVVYQY